MTDAELAALEDEIKAAPIGEPMQKIFLVFTAQMRWSMVQDARISALERGTVAVKEEA